MDQKQSIFHCQSPLRIRNPYTHEWCWVPCRKCASCKSRRVHEWTQRLNIECRCHPYVFFGTLTYAPKYLPYLNVDWSRKVLFSSSLDCEYNFEDLPLDKNSYDFIKARRCLPVANVQDVQKFIKRVRERIRTNSSGEGSEMRYLRYYLVSDFGSTLLRPHYHFIFFTGSKWFAENAKCIVSDCWKTDNRHSSSESLGRVDCQSVKSSASSYVASYVNCLDSLPKVYSFRKFRPFSICSRHPPLGTLFKNDGEIKRLFDSGSCTRRVWNSSQNEFLDVPIPKGLCDRLYPRIKGFGTFSLDVLYRLYSRAAECSGSGFDWFEHCVRSYCRKGDDLADYFRKLISDDNPDTHGSLLSLYSVFSRFNLQRSVFGISVNDYVRRIFDFYKDRDYLMLKSQFEWSERVSKELSPTYSLMVDPDLVSVLRTNIQNSFDLGKYGLFFDDDAFSSDVLHDMSPEDDFFSREKFELANKVISDGKKKHEKADYLDRANINSDLKDFLKQFNSVKYGYKKCD